MSDRRLDIWDTPSAYGLVSRFFHWLMAALFVLIYLSAVLHFWNREAAITKMFFAQHFNVGFSLLILTLVRGVWALMNAGRRRAAGGKAVLDRLARWHHVAMYILMLVIPLLAMMRSYGSGRGFSWFGIQLIAASEDKIPYLMVPANLVHGLFGWLLLVLVIGHAGMAFLHFRSWKDDVLRRMWPSNSVRQVRG